MQLAQQSGESLQKYIMRLKTMSIAAEQAVRDARTLQEHTLAAYKQAIADAAPLQKEHDVSAAENETGVHRRRSESDRAASNRR